MSSPKGYIYAELDVNNPEYFNAEYAPRVQPVLQKYGARFLIAGGAPQVREGDRTVKRVVFLEFDSPQRAREFYDSKDYQDVIGYRFDSARTHLYILEGTDSGAAAVSR
jgi:uncharacterized protein (DUF1330 family)